MQAGGDQLLGPRGVKVLNGSVHGMGFGILMTGDAGFVEKVAAFGNPGGGISVAGSVIESAATQNGAFGIIAFIVRDCISRENAGDGILADTEGGLAAGNVSSLNAGYGISVQYGTATGNTLFLDKSFGISAFCPSSIVGNTIVADGGGNIETSHDGCAVVNNASRP